MNKNQKWVALFVPTRLLNTVFIDLVKIARIVQVIGNFHNFSFLLYFGKTTYVPPNKKPILLTEEWASTPNISDRWVAPLPIIIRPVALRPILSKGLPFSQLPLLSASQGKTFEVCDEIMNCFK